MCNGGFCYLSKFSCLIFLVFTSVKCDTRQAVFTHYYSTAGLLATFCVSDFCPSCRDVLSENYANITKQQQTLVGLVNSTVGTVVMFRMRS